MKRMKKPIAILLSVMMLVSAATPSMVFADTSEDVTIDPPEVTGEIVIEQEDEGIVEEGTDSSYDAQAPPEEAEINNVTVQEEPVGETTGDPSEEVTEQQEEVTEVPSEGVVDESTPEDEEKVTEEPVEETKNEEPTPEGPTPSETEEPATEEPTTEEPTNNKEEEVVEEEKVEEPKEEPTEPEVTEEPKEEVEEPKAEEPIKEEEVVEEHKADEPTEVEEPLAKESEAPKVEEKSVSDIAKEAFSFVSVMKVFEGKEGSILRYPLSKTALLTSVFGSREPISTPGGVSGTFHSGIDLAINKGTEVLAAEDGVVTRAGYYEGWGNTVFIEHQDGLETRYAHLSQVNVEVGQTVVRGQQIGLVGSTGMSTGPHLHFEVLVDGVNVDPLPYLSELGEVANLDFTSKRLIAKTDKEEVLKDEPVIANLDGIFLIQYETIDEVKAAYLRLIQKCDSVEVDSVISIAEGEEAGTPTEYMTEEENPFAEAENVNVTREQFDVAVIDTGANEADKILSVIGDDGKDVNGHGQKMIDIIKATAPSSKVISIKAMGDNGVGDTSSVYAAIKLAIKEEVKVINLSISALATEDSFIIEEAISEAIEKGIKVVGAAGNNGLDAKLFIPGRIEDAVIVGASKGNTSNYGDTVDYIVDVNTTSSAAALVTGLILSERIDIYAKEIVLSLDIDEALKAYQEYGTLFRIADGTGSGTGMIKPGGVNVGNYAWTAKNHLWFDRGGWIDETTPGSEMYPAQPIMYPNGSFKLNGSTVTLSQVVDFWEQKMNLRMGTTGYYAGPFNDNTATRNEFRDYLGAAIRDASNNALSEDEEGKYARVIGIAWEFQNPGGTAGPHTIDYSSWVWENYWNHNANRAFPDTFDDLFEGVPADAIDSSGFGLSSDYGWSSEVDINNDGIYEPNETWRTYIYNKNKAAQDAIYYGPDGNPEGFTYLSSYIRLYVVAVTDNQPDTEEKMDPIGILLQKRDSKTGTGTPQGNGTLANAQFTVKYYDNLTQSGDPERTWVFKTNENGYLTYLNMYKVSGPDLYYDSRNVPSIPAGSITIQETTPPTGYTVDPTIYTVYFVEKNGEVRAYQDAAGTIPYGTVNTTNELEDLSLVVEEESISGWGYATKKDASGTEQGDAKVQGIKIALVTRNTNPVVYNDVTYSANEIIDVLTIASDGNTRFTSELPYGDYEFIELKRDEWDTFTVGKNINNLTRGISIYANDTGYLWKDNKDEFSIETDGETHAANFTNDPLKGGIQVKKGSIRGEAVGDAKLTGIRFAIVNRSAKAVKIGSTTYPVGTVVKILTLNADGFAQTGNTELPYGTYEIYELRKDATISVGDTYAGSNKLGTSDLANDSYKWKDNHAEYKIRVQGEYKKLNSDIIKNDFTNTETDGKIYIKKQDSQLTPQGDASIVGIRFAIVNTSASPIYYNGETFNVGEIVRVLSINSEGKTDATTLPYGKYTVYELKKDEWNTFVKHAVFSSLTRGTSIYANNAGYLWKNNREQVSAYENGKTYEVSFTNDIARGGISIIKWDKGLARAASQGDADLSGIKFEIWNRSANTVRVGGVDYAPGAKIANTVLTTDSAGKASTANNRLPYGTYEIKETATNGSYMLTDTESRTFEIRENGVIVTKTATNNADLLWKNVVRRGGIKFGKIDAERNENIPQGQATLKGAEITIYNNSAKAVLVNGVEYAKGKAVMTVTTGENGEVTTGKNDLPYGTYYAVETKPSEGYLLNSSYRVDFQVREDGKIIDTTSASHKIALPADENKSGWIKVTGSSNAAKLPEQVIRADLKFFKVNIDGSKQAYIPFLVQRLDKDGNVVESHVILSDKDGNVDTTLSSRPKTAANVNKLDAYWNEADGTYTGPLDEAAAKGNIWFGEKSAISNGKGSLVYSAYKVTELKSENNDIEDILVQDVIKKEDLKTQFTDGKVFSLDNIFVNLIIHPESVLIDVATGKTTVSIKEDARVKDSVRWDHLKVGQKYKLRTVINYEDREGDVRKLGENSVTFVPSQVDSTNTSLGITDNTVTIDTSNLNGGKVHAVDYIYAIRDGMEILIASHNTDMNIESQTLGVPYVETIASDSKTNDHVGTIEVEASIEDIIKYENLPEDSMFRVVGRLVDRDTEELVSEIERVLRISNRVTTPSYRPDGTIVAPKSGEIKMPAFTFDASEMAGRTLVVQEIFYDYDTEEEFIRHDSLMDENQSVHYVKIETEARDAKTGTRTGVVGETETIIDTVTITNAIPGMEYVITGELVYQEDCVTADGKVHQKGEVIAKQKEDVRIIAESTTEVVEVEFEVDSSMLAGTSGVVFEDAYHNDVKVATHHDYNAIPQTPNWPEVRTKAIDKVTETHTGVVGEEAVIVDTVELKNLTVGDSYKVVGTLMNTDGTEFTVDGNPVTVESEVFTAEEKNMTLDLEFAFDSSELKGKSLVVFEKLIFVGEDEPVIDEEGNPVIDEEGNPVTEPKEIEVSRHEDPEDEGQTVDFPDVSTSAYDSKTESHVGTVGEKEIIVDKATFHNLRIGETYEIKGSLYYAEDFTDKYGVEHKKGDVIKDSSGNEITSTTGTFTADTKDGFKLITFEVDSSLLEGASVVVFEDLYTNNVKVAAHADLEDENQRVDYPEVKTTLLSKKTGDHVGDTDSKTVMVDTVALKNLIVGETYTVRGTLMDKDTGAPVKNADGSEVTSDPYTFEATERDMTIEIEFTLDGKARENMTTVAFEELIHNGVVVNVHADINDKDQTVWTPKVVTEAKDAETGTNVGMPREETVIIDKITLSNLIVGREYTVSGYLMNQETGEKYIDADGKEVVGEPITFTAEKATEVKEMKFTFNGSNLKGKTVVVFEDLKHNDVTVASHHDINSIPQSVDYPEGKTEAKDAKTETHMTKAEEKAVVIDMFYYKNLRVGLTYLLKAELVNKATGEVIAMQTLTFKPEKKNDSVPVEFTFNAELLKGQTLVAFETVEYNGIEVIVHKDLEDEEQTIYIPEVGTEAKDVKTENHTTFAEKDAEVLDTVTYKNLVPGKIYTVTGVLMDKETGEPLLVNGKEVTAEKTFEAKKATGEVEIKFVFDASALMGKTLVAFEKVLYEGKEVAAHEDITDEDQTIYIPEARTFASTMNGGKTVEAGKEVELKDIVDYKNLTPGKAYILKATVMDKVTGKPAQRNGEDVVVIKEFTPDAKDGQVEITAKVLPIDGHDLVFFEEIFEKGEPKEDNPEELVYGPKVAEHKDMDDINQTVTVKSPPTTGDTNDVMPSLLLFALAVAGMTVLVYKKRKEERE